MENYNITLKTILGEEKFRQLVDYTLKNVQKKFGNIEANLIAEAAYVNHQAILIVAIQKARNMEKEQIKKNLHWDDMKSYKMLISEEYEEFIDMYSEYISEIVNYIKKRGYCE